MCPSNDSFDKIKILSVLGLNSKDMTSNRDKANISNPKVNRGCAPLTASRTSADCVQISLGPSIPYIPLGVYHTEGFNDMNVYSILFSAVGLRKDSMHYEIMLGLYFRET